MNTLLVVVISIFIFGFAFRFYARYISKFFNEDDSHPTPAKTINDGIDYVPSKSLVVFSHHFSSIAGAGPIVGPTVALLYGFYPTWLWIILGAIFIGAVHDMASIFVSIREKGNSIVEIAKKTMGKAGFTLFIIFVFFMLLLVCAAFLDLTCVALTSMVKLKLLNLPETQTLFRTVIEPKTGESMAVVGGIASTSVIIITAFAPLIGYLLYRRNMRVFYAVMLSLIIIALSVIIGFALPVRFSRETWMMLVSIYCFIASAIPIWIVLQPRDFINSFFLYGGIIALIISAIVGGLKGIEVTTPPLNIAEGAAKLGPIWPILFITVACGAISGFHTLVGTGTTVKQISKESDARKIGYGAMLVESILSVGVIVALGAGLAYASYKDIVFPQAGKSNPVLAFALGSGLFMEKALGIPSYVGIIFGILMIEGFVITTLDTAVRLGRLILQEFWRTLFKKPPRVIFSRFFNSTIMIVSMFLLAYKNGFAIVWPVFGSANQLMAALALIALSLWLTMMQKKRLFTILPALFMLATTIYSLGFLLTKKFIPSGNFPLIGITIILFLLAWFVFGIAVRKFIEYAKNKEVTVKA
ncbi:carbon starvation protein A [Thermodesulfovibrio sp. Kuro-1]|uniref:carbon starvation CstA family protein n=1 Tax=Thermodesulfovibrio sp. Kuro-1 TaxID=2580394 RepID=UPI0011433F6E|nr:carbon starvation CstA family protein [Thermodesulfovibrio sp. Kuro-1]